MQKLIDFLQRFGELVVFAARAVGSLARRPFEVRETIRQIAEIGYASLPLITAAGLSVGAVMSMHTRASLERFGAEALIPAALAIAMIRETGPLVTGLLVAGRVGASIGAELGAMRVTEQIDALETLAVDSFKFLAVSRILACMIALPILTTVMDFTGILGGFVVETAISNMSFELYFQQAFSGVGFADFITSTLKTTVFGFIIGTIGSFIGYTASGGSAGVGRASTQSVVFSSISLIVVNVVLVRVIFFLFPEMQ